MIDPTAAILRDRSSRPMRPTAPFLAGAVTVLIVLIAAVACGDDEPSPSPSPTGNPPETPVITTSAEPTSPPPGSEFDDAIEAASADLALRFGYDAASIAVERAEPVTWPNAGLGCPKVDASYDPDPVDGYRVVLVTLDGLRFHYHGTAGDPSPFLCQFLD